MATCSTSILGTSSPHRWYLELIFLPITGVDQQVSICDPLAGCHKHVSSLGFTLEVSGQLLYVHMHAVTRPSVAIKAVL